MYVSMMVNDCDFDDKKYDGYTQGAGCLAQGATGRWCVVMTAGPDYLIRNGITPISRDEAVKKCLDILKEQNALRPEDKRYSDDALTQWIDF